MFHCTSSLRNTNNVIKYDFLHMTQIGQVLRHQCFSRRRLPHLLGVRSTFLLPWSAENMFCWCAGTELHSANTQAEHVPLVCWYWITQCQHTSRTCSADVLVLNYTLPAHQQNMFRWCAGTELHSASTPAEHIPLVCWYWITQCQHTNRTCSAGVLVQNYTVPQLRRP